MRNLVLVIILLVFTVGCTGYPRYRTNSANTPAERGPRITLMDTDEYLRLALIIQEYLGRPYGSRMSNGTPLDCSAFTQKVYRRFNKMQLPRKAKDQFGQGTPVSVRRLEFGDLIFFRTVRNEVSHVGIYVGYGDFVHVSTSRGVMLSNISEDYWSQRFVGARRLIEFRQITN